MNRFPRHPPPIRIPTTSETITNTIEPNFQAAHLTSGMKASTTADLFPDTCDPDAETPGWQMPVLYPRAYTGSEPPQGASCSDCGSFAWWTEAGDPPTRWWRCCCCSPTARPSDRVRVVFTDAQA